MDDMKERLVMLRYDGYADVVDLIEKLEYKANNCISHEAEMEYLKGFAKQSDFGEEIYRKQFRALWTAYCFHHYLDVDTDEYDNRLLELWNSIGKGVDAFTGESDWSCYDRFDQYMCAYLV